MKILLTIVITFIVVIVIGLGVVYSGIYNVAANNAPCGFERWFFSTVMDNSVKHHAADIVAPALDDAAMIDSGFVLASNMCVGCHGAPGVPSQGGGFHPKPPDLSKGVADLSDAEIFWIIKNGIKMTAMPAYSSFSTDAQIWEMVSFVRLFPQMTPDQYQEYQQRLGQPEHR